MSHTHHNLLYHIVFSTKGRIPSLIPECRADIHRYMAGIVKECGGIPLIINGTEDHVHILAVFSQRRSISDAMRDIKAGTSKWIHQTFPTLSDFVWQEGYGAFTVSASQKDRVYAYVQNQEEHHRECTFQEEYVALLQAHGIEYDEHYLWE